MFVGRFVILRVLVCSLAVAQALHAQITLDGSVGPGGPLTGPNYQIPDTVGRTVGNNLFHSFGQFNVNQGESATFTGPANIHNVISRVTGGNPSLIDGALNCDIAGANFFLINPFGVMFGQNAQLNVKGSFTATTADYVKLEDGGRFDARNPANDVLTTAPVSAFGFLGPSPGTIAVRGGDPFAGEPPALLQVPDGQTLSLIGGEIEISNGELLAHSGRVNLLSTGSPGEFALAVDDLLAEPDLSGFSSLGSIAIKDVSLIDVSGDFAAQSRGGRLSIIGDSVQFSNFTQLYADNPGLEPGLGIELNARSELTLDSSTISALSFADGDGGNIHLSAPYIRVDGQGNGGVISTDATGTGGGGDITIDADRFELLNTGAISAAASGAGAGGNITINAEQVLIDGLGNGAFLSTTTFGGVAGDIRITSHSLQIVNLGRISSEAYADNPGGNILIDVDALTLSDNGQISAAALEGTSSGGNIDIHAGNFDVRSGAQISTSSASIGDGGNITIHAGNLTLSDASIQSSANASGKGGTVSINVAGFVFVEDAGFISTSATQSGGGDIAINAGGSIRVFNGQITAQALGDGGSVRLTAPSLIYLLNSQIRAESTEGNGGNVTLDPQLVVLNHSLIKASAIQGNGGNINIVSDFFLSSDSIIDASSEFGLQGTVNIDSPNADLAGDLVGLSADPLNAESRLRPHCAVRLPQGVSSFTIVGRGGTPVEPDGLLPALPEK